MVSHARMKFIHNNKKLLVFLLMACARLNVHKNFNMGQRSTIKILRIRMLVNFGIIQKKKKENAKKCFLKDATSLDALPKTTFGNHLGFWHHFVFKATF
jgi:hypothetical protein